MQGLLRRGAIWALVATLVMGAHGAAAQTGGTAALQGQVMDEQGGAVPGVTVTAVNAATGLTRTTVTGGTGNYQFVSLPPGVYEVRVELTGFRTAVYESVPLGVDSTVRLDARLQIGALTDTIQVVAETAVINTTDASLGNVISGSQIRELPLEGRNVVGLLSLQPGVVYVPPTGATDARSGSVSGSRADQSNVTLDGIDVNDNQFQDAFTSVLRVTLDSVQEFRVTTSNYGADQGRSSGAQVSLVTRGGTNAFQGTGYWSHRNTATSSTPYFTKLSQLRAGLEPTPPKLNKHIYGGAFGGPIRRDRLFFFGNFEGLQESSEAPVNRAVPSMSMRDGVLIYLCASAAECPGGSVQGFSSSHTVPAGSFGVGPAATSRIDPLGVGSSLAASQYWKQFPEPNDPGRDGRNIMGYRFNSPIENRFRTYISRLDYRTAASNSIFGRFNFQDDAVASAAQFPGQPSTTTRTV
ncbi:MAG: carboxypeptidase regulatory-like domain-containing protein, partial [Acidobacteria bacterium]|nr:carboxypeptidase regulatory-like domain-containing protein [Acidobacteriota bacterium]